MLTEITEEDLVELDSYPDVNDVANFVHFHERGKRDCSMCAELAGKQIPGTSTITLGVGHFDA